MTLRDYFFFTFVREPVSRFYASYAQKLRRGGTAESLYPGLRARFEAASEQGRRDMMLETLQSLESGRCHEDIHFESQSMSLSTPLHNGYALPIDFIGDLDNLGADFALMLRRAANKTGIGHSAQVLRRAQQLLEVNTDATQHPITAEIEPMVKTLRNDALDERIRAVYTQDVACFGVERTF